MKNLLLLLCICLPVFSFSQTVQLEKDYMNNLITTKAITVDESRQLAKDWAEFMKNNQYPELPYNEELGMFEFKQVAELDGLTMDVAYDRAIEWIALNFGNINNVLHYGNSEDGKIIVKGFLKLANKTDYRSFGERQRKKLKSQKVSLHWSLL